MQIVDIIGSKRNKDFYEIEENIGLYCLKNRFESWNINIIPSDFNQILLRSEDLEVFFEKKLGLIYNNLPIKTEFNNNLMHIWEPTTI